jgi:inner membrane protein involved in colicin E2 resistance
VLILLLLIPLATVSGVLSDRLNRRNEAVADITSSWGKNNVSSAQCSGFRINTDTKP